MSHFYFYTDITFKSKIEQDNTACGADSFMLRDGVCDDPSNIPKCFYDGGDCCKENKNTDLCRECKCIIDVDFENMYETFGELQIKPVWDSEKFHALIETSWSVIKVDDVISGQVCAALCLEHEMADEFNAWHYHVNDEICNCGWVDSASCPEEMVANYWSNDTVLKMSTFVKRKAFIQIEKTVPCCTFLASQLRVSFATTKSCFFYKQLAWHLVF